MSYRYCSLHQHSDFSLMDSLNKVEDLAKKAKEVGMPAICLSDHGNCYGFVKMAKECKKQGIKFIPAQEFYFTHDHDKKERRSRHITILCKDNQGLENIYKMTTVANKPVDDGGGFFTRPRISWRELEEYNEGLICLLGCMNSPVNHEFGENEDYETGKEYAKYLLEIFGRNRFYAEIQLVNDPINSPSRQIYIPEQDRILKWTRQLAKELDLKCVATNDSHWITRDDAFPHEVLKAIEARGSLKTPVVGPGVKRGRLVFSGFDYYVKSHEEMLEKFTKEEVEMSGRIAEMCNVDIKFKQDHMPQFNNDLNDEEVYKKLLEECRKGWVELKINDKLNKEEYVIRIKKELSDIKGASLQNYFMIVWDVCRFCRENNIPIGFSRGSAGGSLVSYLLGITNKIDPIKYNLIWERFWNAGRKGSMPDIDLDVCVERRGEVIEYLKDKFGHDKVYPMMTIGTMQTKQALQDVGKVMGLDFEYTLRLTKNVPHKCKSIKDAIESNDIIKKASEGVDADTVEWESKLAIAENYKDKVDLRSKISERKKALKKTFQVAQRLEGVARQRGKHACAMLISDVPVFGQLPLCLDSKNGKKTMMTGFDMYDLEELGFLKLDVLGLKTLTVASRIMPDYLGQLGDFDDPKVYELMSEGNTKGVFQLEKPLGQNWAKKVKPQSLEDIGDLISLIRPAVLETGLAKQYVDQKFSGERQYIHDDLEPIMNKTMGIMLYQEQMIEIAKKFAGFSLEDADSIRKACLAEGSLVLTNRGPIEIENIKTGKILTIDNYGKLKYSKINSVWKSGYKKIFKIKTRNGYQIEVTDNHEIYTQDGWKKVRDINENDYVIVPTHYSYKGSFREKDGKKINVNMALILAYFIGEGCYTELADSKITNSDKWILNKVRKALKDEFGKNSWREYNQKNGCIDIYFKNDAKIWIEKVYNKCRARDKYLPNWLVNIGNSASQCFIGSYFSGEGCVNFDNKSLDISSTSKDICSKIQMLLLRDGIHSSLQIHNSKYKGELYISYRTCVSGENVHKFYNTYKRFICPEKLKKIERIKEYKTKHKNSRLSVPECFIKSVAKVNNLSAILGKVACGSVHNKPITYEKAARLNQKINSELLEDILTSEYRFVKIENIIESGYKNVYDFSVDDEAKCGFINGILVHNCGKKLPEEMKKYKEEFISGCLSNNYPAEVADKLWEWINASAGYSFNASHAIGYGMLSYLTAYMKAHMPLEFFCAMLQLSSNKQDEHEEISELFYDAKLFNIDILPPSVSECNEDFAIVGGDIRFGIGHIKGVGKTSIGKIKKLKGLSWDEVLQKGGVKKDVLQALIFSGSFDHLATDKMDRFKMSRMAALYSEFTDKELEILNLIREGGTKTVELKKETREFTFKKQEGLEDVIKYLQLFIKEHNSKLKFINARRAKTLETLLNEYLLDDVIGSNSIKQIAAKESHYLGIALTCSEVDVYDDPRKTHDLIDVKREIDRKGVGTIGVIKRVKKTKDKNGGEMAFVTLADSTYMMDSIIFRDQFKEFGDILEQGLAVYVEGFMSRGSLIVQNLEVL